MEAYLDIETTGLSPRDCRITVIGIYRWWGKGGEFVQLYDERLTARDLLAALEGVTCLHTYNGQRFDLPFIKAQLGVDLEAMYPHRDLMLDCWRLGLNGGLKAVESRIGIQRELKGINGLDAVILWMRYERKGDLKALETLLKYNKEDVMNLLPLRCELDARLATMTSFTRHDIG
ncbi:MAG: ribonuclease H-like domain-containing protein [Dehalococcoidia bacterium]|nr:ribonuclease H-like domain-containing protein [Dehalococcoidia bacterium]